MNRREKEILQQKIKDLSTSIIHIIENKSENLHSINGKRNEIEKWIEQFNEMLTDEEMVKKCKTLDEYKDFLNVSFLELMLQKYEVGNSLTETV